MERIAVIGGDGRMKRLVRLLRRDGYEVSVWPEEDGAGEESLARIGEADRVVLPVPLEANGRLNGTELPLRELWPRLRAGQRVYAGAVSDAAQVEAAASGVTLTDCLRREELAVKNAVPTAEGAIAAAMERLSVTLHGAPCLVLGFGRIGKLLAKDLSALGARVSVSARRAADLAWIDAFGYGALHTHRLHGRVGEFRVIFNTVPQRVMDAALLSELRPDCLLVELASRDGFDREAVEAGNIEYVKASGLPGKCAPETAAEAICETLKQIWEEDG